MSILRSSTVAVATLVLSACATSHAPLARVQPDAPAVQPVASVAAATIEDPAAGTLPASRSRSERDAAYMAVVERVARRRGIVVQWVHPPLTRVASAD